MPRNKDLKRLTRSRMHKTGEAYTTARAQLLKKKAAPESEGKPDYAALAGMSDEAVKAKTGCDWEHWVFVLDRAGAELMPHREIAQHIHDKYQVSGWWSQTVTVGYERIKGLREIGQRRGGLYDANKSKTFPVPVARLYRTCRNARSRDRWLGDVDLTVRKATPEKSVRITWHDGTLVEMYFYPKGEEKSSVSIQHRRLPSKAAAEEMKGFWGERLAALAGLLKPS